MPARIKGPIWRFALTETGAKLHLVRGMKDLTLCNYTVHERVDAIVAMATKDEDRCRFCIDTAEGIIYRRMRRLALSRLVRVA